MSDYAPLHVEEARALHSRKLVDDVVRRDGQKVRHVEAIIPALQQRAGGRSALSPRDLEGRGDRVTAHHHFGRLPSKGRRSACRIFASIQVALQHEADLCPLSSTYGTTPAAAIRMPMKLGGGRCVAYWRRRVRRHCEVDEKAAHHDCRIERRGSLRRHKLVRRDHSMIKFGIAQCVCEVTKGFSQHT